MNKMPPFDQHDLGSFTPFSGEIDNVTNTRACEPWLSPVALKERLAEVERILKDMRKAVLIRFGLMAAVPFLAISVTSILAIVAFQGAADEVQAPTMPRNDNGWPFGNAPPSGYDGPKHAFKSMTAAMIVMVVLTVFAMIFACVMKVLIVKKILSFSGDVKDKLQEFNQRDGNMIQWALIKGSQINIGTDVNSRRGGFALYRSYYYVIRVEVQRPEDRWHEPPAYVSAAQSNDLPVRICL